MEKIVFEFSRGGKLEGELFTNTTPRTYDYLQNILPLQDVKLYHSRWCGREINIPIANSDFNLPPQENQTVQTSAGDIVYWREWPGSFQNTGQEALAIYYGAEYVRDYRGSLPVNHIGHINYEQLNDVKKIGERVWKEGIESTSCIIKQREL
jgi:hypothetical protein